MRSKSMLTCSGLAGAALLSCLIAQGAYGQNGSLDKSAGGDTSQDLKFDSQHTSRRSNPLDLFKLNSRKPQAEPSPPHLISTAVDTATVVSPTAPFPTAPVAAAPVTAAPLVDPLVEIDLGEAAAPTTHLLWQEPSSSVGQSGLPAADQPEADSSEFNSANETEEDDPEERLQQLTPDQTRPLSVEVVAINVGKAEVGTGVLPPGAKRVTVPSSYLATGVERGAIPTAVYWQPSLVCHYPLYFEDAMLERHGQVRWGHLQSLASGIKFYSTIPMLPYLYTLRPKHDCIYQVGHYRAGSCAPVLKDHLPYDQRAAVVEGLSLASFFWAMPL